MSLSLKIAVISLNIAWADVDENLMMADDAIRKLPPEIDLVVLPELFSTGFIHDVETLAALAEDEYGKTLKFLKKRAADSEVAIAGSFLFKSGGRFYNRAFFVEPNGEFTFYDKHHLFCVSEESELFAPGDELPPVVRYRGWNISMIVCYDLRFPVWCRNLGLRYDIMLVPANWPDSRSFAWGRLLSARAIENQAYVVGANRSGQDDYGQYDGLSMVIDGLGQIISKEVSGVVYAVADMDTLQHERRKLPVSRDADDYKIMF